MTKLSDTQRVILSQAGQRDDRLAVPPERLPAAARQTVARSLVKLGLVHDEEASAHAARNAWQIDGQPRLLRITDAGLRAIGVTMDQPTGVDAAELSRLSEAEYEEEQALAQGALDACGDLRVDATQAGERALLRPEIGVVPVTGEGDSLAACPPSAPADGANAAQAPSRPPIRQQKGTGRAAALRMAAARVLAAWDAPDRERLDDAIGALQAALATRPGRAPRDSSALRQARAGTKQETVLAMLRRDEGATVAQIINATGWQQHTVRGFLAGLKRKGIEVEILERVRQVGPSKQGAKGSYSIYRIAAVAAAAPAQAG